MPYTQQETLQVSAKLNAMNTHHFLIAAALSACSCSVFAQWQWVDDTGRKVFSDRPPPAHIAPNKILKQPEGKSPAAERVLYPMDGAAAGTAAPTPATPDAGTIAQAKGQATAEPNKQEAENAAQDKALEEAKRKAEESEQKKLQAQQAKARQDNCARARASQVTLESGIRLAHVNEKGEHGFLSEAQRQADLQRAQKGIKENCAS